MKGRSEQGMSVLEAYRERLSFELTRKGGEESPVLRKTVREMLNRLGDEAIKNYRRRLLGR